MNIIDNKHLEKNIISFPSNKSYDLVTKTQVHAHPVKKGYPNAIPKYLTIRKSGGIIESIYYIIKTIDLNPKNYENDIHILTYEEQNKISSYIENCWKQFGFEYSDSYTYRFYILEKFIDLSPVFVQTPNLRSYNYYCLQDFSNHIQNFSSIFNEDYPYLNAPRIKNKDDWKTILYNEINNTGFNFINVLTEIYNSPNKTVFCHELEEKMNIKGLNLRVGEFRDRINKIPEIKIDKQIRLDSNTDRAWNLPFTSNEEINNMPQNKGKFCWVLRDELIEAMEEVFPNIKQKQRILFCNIAYMKYYDYFNIKETPINGGSYVSETMDAFEKNNFHICEDHIVRGFVETKYINGAFDDKKIPKQLHIERIDSTYKDKDSIDNTLVVFCSQSPALNKKVIIGWYSNATVHRKREYYNGREFNLETIGKKAVLLPVKERIKEVPLARSSNNFLGFGQANIWFADKPEHQSFVNEITNYIKKTEQRLTIVNQKQLNKKIDDKFNENIKTESVIINETFEYSNEIVPKPILLRNKKGIAYYKRDRKKALNALQHANYECEYNSQHESFIRKNDGVKYTEAHHLIPMAFQDDFDVSIDVEENIVSLCSNCHNEIHYGKDAEKLITKLYNKRKDILKENKGIEIDLETLLSYYK